MQYEISWHSARKTVEQLKEAGEDREWYPTTYEIVGKVAEIAGPLLIGFNCKRRVMDIGAGDGRVLVGLEKLISKPSNYDFDYEGDYLQKYAIEQSSILAGLIPSNIFVIGTDFKIQTLIDKQMDLIFCNPPYSEYEDWTIKIIREAYCRHIIMVIPERWKDSKRISDAIAETRFKATVEGSFDFNDGDRAARANVDIVLFSQPSRGYYGGEADDPFDRWFNQHFKIQTTSVDDKPEHIENRIHDSLVPGANLIERMEEIFNAEMANLLSAYKALENLSPRLLREMDITISNAVAALKVKISGLKNSFWRELFSRLDKLTGRLTHDSRKKMLDKLTAHTCIDFTADNIYAVVVWAIKNANQYFDQQLLELFEAMTYKDYIINYKSNQRIIKSEWAYCYGKELREKDPHFTYKLDYRIIWHCGSCFGGYWRDNMHPCGISDRAWQQINDFCVVARNLGFDVLNSPDDFKWVAGKKNVFMMKWKSKKVVFAEIKAYLNGNIHTKFNQDFMARFNIEAGRLKGWLHTPGDAVDEIGVKPEQAAECFKANFQLGTGREGVLMITME